MTAPPATSSGTVLIVDDNIDGCKALARIVRYLGHRGICVEDGEQALAYLRVARPDVIVLDIMMPGKDGFEVLKTIREDPALAGLPVIMFSALDDQVSIDRATGGGATAYWIKSRLTFDDVKRQLLAYLPGCDDAV